MIRFVAAIVVLLAGSVQAFACRVPFIRTFDNQTVSGQMVAQSGKPCSILLNRTIGPMLSAAVIERPTSGTASVGAGNRIIYVSRAGYVGRDAFTYTRTGLNSHNHKVVRTVRVSVFVRAPRVVTTDSRR